MQWSMQLHDDVIKWKHFPRSWPFVRGISPHKGKWRGALMFSWSASEWTFEKTVVRLVIWDADVPIMTLLSWKKCPWHLLCYTWTWWTLLYATHDRIICTYSISKIGYFQAITNWWIYMFFNTNSFILFRDAPVACHIIMTYAKLRLQVPEKNESNI